MFNEQENHKTLKVALYIRVSTDEQVEKYGLGLQEEALRALIKSKGRLPDGQPAWELAGEKYIYKEEGASGASDIDTRPAFIRLKEDILSAPIENKPFDIVAVYRIDRFARSLKILYEIIEFFQENEIQFVSANENIDTSSPFGKAILGIIGIIAELELATITKRTKDGREQAAKSGVVMGAGAPYGYQKNENKRLKIVKEEANTIREIFRLFTEEKRSTYEIGKILEEQEIIIPEASSIKNKKRKGEIRNIKTSIYFWRPEQIRLILQDEIYIGKYYYNKSKNRKRLEKSEWKLAESLAPAIIDTATFYRAQTLLGTSRLSKPESISKHIYLLKGLLKCESCFDINKDNNRISWTGDRKEIADGKFSYYYRCGRKTIAKHKTHCRTLPIPAKELEEYIVNSIRNLLKNPTDVFNHQINLKSTRAEVKQLQSKRNGLAELLNNLPARRLLYAEEHQARALTTSQLKDKIKELEEKEIKFRKGIKELDEEISKKTLSEGYTESLLLFSEKYSDMLQNIDKNREDIYIILHKVIEEIIVLSRPVTEKDSISGKKKKDQMIPSRLHIKLKLPQAIIQELAVRGNNMEFVGAQGFEPWTPSV